MEGSKDPARRDLIHLPTSLTTWFLYHLVSLASAYKMQPNIRSLQPACGLVRGGSALLGSFSRPRTLLLRPEQAHGVQVSIMKANS